VCECVKLFQQHIQHTKTEIPHDSGFHTALLLGVDVSNGGQKVKIKNEWTVSTSDQIIEFMR
jgi:hypothetical protein